MRRAVNGSVLSARSRSGKSANPRVGISLRRVRFRFLPLSRGRVSGPVPDTIHDPFGSSDCGSGANRNRHEHPWLQPRCPGWSPALPITEVMLSPTRCRMRRISPELPFAPFGSNPFPFSQKRFAGGPLSSCFRTRWPGLRLYGWLSPQGSSIESRLWR
jgi:hypothetical protein